MVGIEQNVFEWSNLIGQFSDTERASNNERAIPTVANIFTFSVVPGFWTPFCTQCNNIGILPPELPELTRVHSPPSSTSIQTNDSSSWSSQALYRPSTIQAQCCVSSVFKMELMFSPTGT